MQCSCVINWWKDSSSFVSQLIVSIWKSRLFALRTDFQVSAHFFLIFVISFLVCYTAATCPGSCSKIYVHIYALEKYGVTVLELGCVLEFRCACFLHQLKIVLFEISFFPLNCFFFGIFNAAQFRKWSDDANASCVVFKMKNTWPQFSSGLVQQRHKNIQTENINRSPWRPISQYFVFPVTPQLAQRMPKSGLGPPTQTSFQNLHFQTPVPLVPGL